MTNDREREIRDRVAREKEFPASYPTQAEQDRDFLLSILTALRGELAAAQKSLEAEKARADFEKDRADEGWAGRKVYSEAVDKAEAALAESKQARRLEHDNAQAALAEERAKVKPFSKLYAELQEERSRREAAETACLIWDKRMKDIVSERDTLALRVEELGREIEEARRYFSNHGPHERAEHLARVLQKAALRKPSDGGQPGAQEKCEKCGMLIDSGPGDNRCDCPRKSVGQTNSRKPGEEGEL